MTVIHTGAPATRYRLAMFDFDGTLANSFPFLLSVFNTLAAQHGFRPIDTTRAEAMRHLGVREMMQRVGMPAWKLPAVSASFIAMMHDSADRVQLFDGAANTIKALAAAQMPLAIVSSNSEQNVRRILGADMAGHFSQFECGMSVFGKASRLRRVLKAMRIAPHDAIYVGDHGADAEAAHKAGVAFGAVSWGYCPVASMRGYGAAMVFDSPADLLRIGTGPSADHITGPAA